MQRLCRKEVKTIIRNADCSLLNYIYVMKLMAEQFCCYY